MWSLSCFIRCEDLQRILQEETCLIGKDTLYGWRKAFNCCHRQHNYRFLGPHFCFSSIGNPQKCRFALDHSLVVFCVFFVFSPGRVLYWYSRLWKRVRRWGVDLREISTVPRVCPCDTVNSFREEGGKKSVIMRTNFTWGRYQLQMPVPRSYAAHFFARWKFENDFFGKLRILVRGGSHRILLPMFLLTFSKYIGRWIVATQICIPDLKRIICGLPPIFDTKAEFVRASRCQDAQSKEGHPPSFSANLCFFTQFTPTYCTTDLFESEAK